MNLEQEIKESLWLNIKNNFDSMDYAGAVLDAMHTLSDVLRERSGVSGDGAKLVGQVFGGDKPKLKINKFHTESERDEQRGVEQLLRGLYQGIRNPRSHEKYSDTKETAEALILFVNYLLALIDSAKSPFDVEDYARRVFDPAFVEDHKYAALLVSEIPKRKRKEVFLSVFKDKERGQGKKLEYFIPALLAKLSREEKKEVCEIVSEELKETAQESSIRMIAQVLPAEFWDKFEKTSRMRIEGMMLKSIHEGLYDLSRRKCKSGALGTWISRLGSNLIMRDQVEKALLKKLLSDAVEEQDYVFNFFFLLSSLAPIPSKHVQEVINKGLKDGDIRYYNALTDVMSSGSEWAKPFKDGYNSFIKPESAQKDEIPW